MAGSKTIKKILLENKVPIKDIAQMMGIQAQSLSNKMNRDSFSFEDILIIADILNCDVKFIMRDSGIIIEPDIPEYKSNLNTTHEPKEKTEIEKECE